MISRYFLLNRPKYQSVSQVLSKAPIVGLYRNEKPKHWYPFFSLFCSFVKSEEGPRGEAIKYSRQYLNRNKSLTREMLEPLRLHPNYLIRDVYVKFKGYVPSELYLKYQGEKEKLEEMEENLRGFEEGESGVNRKIVAGLKGKHGEGYDVQGKLREIVELYRGKYEQRKEQVHKLQGILHQEQRYLRYVRMKQYLQPVISIFDRVEKQIGISNVQRGKEFQQKCLQSGLTQLFQRINRRKQDFQVITNTRWEPSELGEVDIALIQCINGQRIVTVLIQCKARLFDIRAGVQQIGPDRILKNKRFLRVRGEVVPVLNEAEYFIMTSMPCNDYHLPFESRLKAELEKATKGLAYGEIDADRVYEMLEGKFKGEMSPLEWFNEEAKEHLIIV